MKIWAISDLHLSFACDKPMDIFGGNWENYTQKIQENWQQLIAPEDIVLIAGDISWAMKLEEAVADLQWIDKLNGKKIIIKAPKYSGIIMYAKACGLKFEEITY